ncbi:MAG: hypothetical protein KJ676_08215 [Alphaproteobacteria bacterium]|nr:hypothetical protein [Alphaproteobacteria bacterium]MBU1524748.1 hypothetical protein [Alphaproteobacteria bacterium]MBU2118590.1 hypothetical protein [Alphaproteobacteria bacterium]MBU2351744.1 hypothetical protein [Alphaproteobacteria bacterium]MBU2383426.1 hypothetical protein [Alphaproteobacteria bacterium]
MRVEIIRNFDLVDTASMKHTQSRQFGRPYRFWDDSIFENASYSLRLNDYIINRTTSPRCYRVTTSSPTGRLEKSEQRGWRVVQPAQSANLGYDRYQLPRAPTPIETLVETARVLPGGQCDTSRVDVAYRGTEIQQME